MSRRTAPSMAIRCSRDRGSAAPSGSSALASSTIDRRTGTLAYPGERTEFEPRIAGFRQRIQAWEAQAKALQDEAAQRHTLSLILGRLEEFAGRVHDQLSGLAHAAQAAVPPHFGTQLVRPAGAGAQAQVEQRHGVHPPEHSCQVHRTTGGRGAGHARDLHRPGHRKCGFVRDDPSNPRYDASSRNDDVHLGARRRGLTGTRRPLPPCFSPAHHASTPRAHSRAPVARGVREL